VRFFSLRALFLYFFVFFFTCQVREAVLQVEQAMALVAQRRARAADASSKADSSGSNNVGGASGGASGGGLVGWAAGLVGGGSSAGAAASASLSAAAAASGGGQDLDEKEEDRVATAALRLVKCLVQPLSAQSRFLLVLRFVCLRTNGSPITQKTSTHSYTTAIAIGRVPPGS